MSINIINYHAIEALPINREEDEDYHKKLWIIYNYIITDKDVLNYINDNSIIIKPIYLIKYLEETEKYRIMRDLKILIENHIDEEDVINIKETIRIAIMRCGIKDPSVINYIPNIIGKSKPTKLMPFFKAFMNKNNYFGNYLIKYKDNGKVLIKKGNVPLPRFEKNYVKLLTDLFNLYYANCAKLSVKYIWQSHCLDFYIITDDFTKASKALDIFINCNGTGAFKELQRYDVFGDIVKEKTKECIEKEKCYVKKMQ